MSEVSGGESALAASTARGYVPVAYLSPCIVELRDRLQSTLGTTYTIERELGGGGMSRVFIAVERALGRRVVVKVLPPDAGAHVSLDRFRREITLAAQLQQANIVPLLSAGDAGGVPFYTMPYVDGESLRTRLSQHGELPVAEAVGILKEVARALAYAHQRGVVHRDIKPDNVLLSGGSAVVTDFGVAKALSASTNSGSGLTSVGVALGTPAYMAPEQATADPLVDHRADIYAFGAMAYEILSGQSPFAGRPTHAMLAAHTSEAPEPLARRRPNVAPALSALVMRCLEKRPADRPQSAAELVQSLDAISISRDGVQPIQSSQRRRQAVVPLAMASAVILVVAALFAMKQQSPEKPQFIAVLPLESGGSTAADSDFAKGMTAEITNALAGINELQVKPRGQSADAWSKDRDAVRVGKTLGARWLITGTAQRHGDSIYISTQLVDTLSGAELIGRNYRTADIYDAQESIARAIVADLRLKVASGQAGPIVKRATLNPEAHALYLQGFVLWDKRGADKLRLAISRFQQAIQLDPSYARAHAGLALAYAILPIYADISIADTLEKARAAAELALKLDPSIAEAEAARAYVLMTSHRNAEATRGFQLALAKDSTFAHTYQWYAIHLSQQRRFDEALRAAQTGRELDPTSRVIGFQTGGILYYARRFAEAEAELRQELQIDSTFLNAHRNLGLVLLATGRPAEAVTEFERTLAHAVGRPSANVGLLAHALHAAGRDREARALLDELLTRSKTQPVAESLIALLYDDFGETEEAIDWLRKAVASFDWAAQRYSVMPVFDHLRADPRAAALLDRTVAMQ